MNSAKYVKLLNEKLEFLIRVYICQVFMRGDAPCHQSKVMKHVPPKKYSSSVATRKSSGLEPDRKCVESNEDKSFLKCASSLGALQTTIKETWVKEISPDDRYKLIDIQGRNKVRWRPGKEACLAPPSSNPRSLGSKFTVLKISLVTLFGVFGAPRSDSAPGELCPPSPLVTPLLTPCHDAGKK